MSEEFDEKTYKKLKAAAKKRMEAAKEKVMEEPAKSTEDMMKELAEKQSKSKFLAERVRSKKTEEDIKARRADKEFIEKEKEHTARKRAKAAQKLKRKRQRQGLE